MKVLAQIDASLIQRAIQKATPLTVAGRTAVENYRRFLLSNTMTASGLESSIASLIQINDAGLEKFVNVLKGIMPAAKRKVAVAYELLQLEPKGSLFEAGVEAANGVAELYKHNAHEIIKEINEGALDQYKTNPVIANLIEYAKSANKDAAGTGIGIQAVSLNIKHSLVPILNIASLGDAGMLVSVDGNFFIAGERGGLTRVTDISAIENIPSDVTSLIRILDSVYIDDKKVNLIRLSSGVSSALQKYFGISDFAIDLLGGIDDFVHMNNMQMSVSKAQELLNANRDSIIAQIAVSEDATEVLKFVNSVLDVFDRYRGVLLSGSYAHVFASDDYRFYVIKSGGYFSTIVVSSGTVVSATKYNSVFEMLADENLIASQDLHDSVANVFSEDLANETNRVTIRQSLLNKLLKERNEYEDLLKRIHANQDELGELSDSNPEKVEQLKAIEKKVSDSLKSVNDEIEKMTSK